MTDFVVSPFTGTKEAAVLEAAEYSLRTGRRYVVRDDFGTLTLCPLYELGKEGLVADVGYQTYGVLVEGQGL